MVGRIAHGSADSNALDSAPTPIEQQAFLRATYEFVEHDTLRAHPLGWHGPLRPGKLTTNDVGTQTADEIVYLPSPPSEDCHEAVPPIRKGLPSLQTDIETQHAEFALHSPLESLGRPCVNPESSDDTRYCTAPSSSLIIPEHALITGQDIVPVSCMAMCNFCKKACGKPFEMREMQICIVLQCLLPKNRLGIA